jgi:hypothetical protein
MTHRQHKIRGLEVLNRIIRDYQVPSQIYIWMLLKSANISFQILTVFPLGVSSKLVTVSHGFINTCYRPTPAPWYQPLQILLPCTHTRRLYRSCSGSSVTSWRPHRYIRSLQRQSRNPVLRCSHFATNNVLYNRIVWSNWFLSFTTFFQLRRFCRVRQTWSWMMNGE